MNSKKLGGFGEELACEYLVKKGYNILERNYRIRFGEIDIIVKKRWSILHPFQKPTIHFVEVKTIVAQDGFFPEDRVDYKKQHKLRKMAEIWLSRKKFKPDYPCQIDVIGIVIDPDTQASTIRYFPNAVEDVKII